MESCQQPRQPAKTMPLSKVMPRCPPWLLSAVLLTLLVSLPVFASYLVTSGTKLELDAYLAAGVGNLQKGSHSLDSISSHYLPLAQQLLTPQASDLPSPGGAVPEPLDLHASSNPAEEGCLKQAVPVEQAHAAVAVAAQDLQELEPTCHLQGAVDECCNCTYQSVDDLNHHVLHPLLGGLVQLPFFRYFKVNIYCDCPLWPDDSMCALQACSVCECDAAEVPQTWLQQETHAQSKSTTPPTQSSTNGSSNGAGVSSSTVVDGISSGIGGSSSSMSGSSGSSQRAPAMALRQLQSVSSFDSSPASGSGLRANACDTALCTAELDMSVDRSMDPAMKSKLLTLKGWRGFNNPWMAEGDEAEEYLYINLLVNEERYTGYKGEHAHRVWHAIYAQSCFERRGICEETRVFHRLISGMHSSISAHIAANYLLDEEKGIWGPSLEQFEERLGHPGVRDRVANLYFAYLFVLRAVVKAGPLLTKFEYVTGLPQEDARTTQLVQQLVTMPELQAACPMPFDEGRLWKAEGSEALREELQRAFQNITRIMDCVGCEKCKLWGKLQTLGVATALKILFSSSDCSGALPSEAGPFATLQLERNEVIALVNLLERFSSSLEQYRQLSAALAAAKAGQQGEKASLTLMPLVGQADLAVS